MAVKQRLMTADKFFAIADDDGKRYELVNGEMIEMPLIGYDHARIAMNLLILLHTYVRARKLGRVYGDGLGYIIRRGPDSVRGPDVSFITQEHVPEAGFSGFVPFAPDLAVEVVSPNDRASEVNDKVRQYLAGGVRLVWVIWPATQSVTIAGRGGVVGKLGVDDTLDGGDVLPGFSVRVSDLFADND